ncbi:MAG: tetratricopeptide repeat protein [Pseudomonadota bacterium]
MRLIQRTLRWPVLLASLALLVACAGKEERAANYLERAQEAFERGDYIKAELDAKNALQITPNNFDATYLIARIGEEDKEPQKMVRFLRRAVEIDPSNVEAQVKMGRIWAAANQLDQARDSIAAIEAVEPGNLEGRVLEATVLLREGQIAESRDVAEAVLEESPRNISALAFLASSYQAEDIDRSLSLLTQAIGYEPDNQSLRVVKVTLLQRNGRLDEAEQELRDLIARFPDQNSYRYALAEFFVTQNRRDESLQVLRDLVAADPEDSKAKLTLAQFTGRSGDADGAVELLKGYIENEPDVYQYRFALGQTYAVMKDFDQAREVYRTVMERDGKGPNGLTARTKLAALELSRGDAELGQSLITEVLEEESANPDALVMRAGIAMREGRFDDATADLRNVLRADPTRENAQVLLGKAHTANGETALAIETYQGLVSTKPNNVEARKDLARLYVREQRWDDVQELLSVGIRQKPDDLAMSRMYVDSLLRVRDWDAADAEAQRLIEMDPQMALGHYVRGRVLQGRGEHAQAIDTLRVALDLNANASEALTSIVRSYVRLEDSDGALQFLQTFTEQNPDKVHGHSLIGELYGRLGRTDEAIASNERALELNETWLPAYRNLIGLYLRQGRLDAAEAKVTTGLAAAPGNVELLILQSNVYEQTQRWDQAIDNYERILESNPNLAVAANNYVALVADHRNDDASLAKAAEFANLLENGNNPIFNDTVGWLYYRQGRVDRAVGLLEEAVAGAGQLPQLRYHLGMAYVAQDRLEDARTELEAALADDDAVFPGVEDARAALERL